MCGNNNNNNNGDFLFHIIVDLVGNHLNSFIFTLFFTYVRM